MKSYFRSEIEKMDGYTPGEQPKMADLVKLNTNENPYPPSPAVQKALKNFDAAHLRRYPDPASDALREAVARRNGLAKEQVICGNGSDDLLTMVFRCFTAPDRPMAMLYPSYSLYAELAAMQNAPVIRIPLTPETFALPENLLELAKPANLLMLTRPNAPTGNTFPCERIREICRNFDGIVVIDEAYADFAEDNCLALAGEFANVVVMRTFSKSYALAGLRLGYAVADKKIIAGMMKVKDSYNVDRLAQELGLAAYLDEEYFRNRRDDVIRERERLSEELRRLDFRVVPSAANFIFASPPDADGERCFRALRQQAIIVRYFPAPPTASYVRITVGTPQENDRLLAALKRLYA